MDLSGFKIKTPAREGKEWQWVPVVGMWNGTVLAVDQSIANTGWAFVRVMTGREPTLMRTGMVTTLVSDRTGHEDTLVRAEAITRAFKELIDFLSPGLVVHEYPPVSGVRGSSMKMKPEISMTSAMAVRAVCTLAGIPVVMVQGQKMKKRITGNGNATKAMVKAALVSHYPAVTRYQPNNEHTRDAVGFALMAAETERAA